MKRSRSKKYSSNVQNRKSSRGRPPKNYSVEIGQVYGRSRIVAIVEGLRARVGVEVRAVCLDCGKFYITRLRRLKRGETKTCGCLKKWHYRNRLAKQVSKLTPKTLEGCWLARRFNLTRCETAAKFKLAVPIVDEAVRAYQAKLDGLAEDGTANQIFQRVDALGGESASTEFIAAEYGLPTAAAQYLIAVARNRIKAAETEEIAEMVRALKACHDAEEVLKLVAERSTRQGSKLYGWTRPNELIVKELRRTRKSVVLGSLARLYGQCRTVDRSLIPDTGKQAVDEFLELAETAFAKRSERSNRFKANLRKGNIEARSQSKREQKINPRS